jgi:prepilin-type N-terminal cleavage/methylation domain-containing protein
MSQRCARGFTLTELAVVLTIVALLLSTLMYTLSAQTEARTREDTLRRIEHAKELLLSFAIVNGRLPYPARCSNWPACNAVGDGGDEAMAGGVCTDSYAGYLPGRAIGFAPLDANGYALDAWGNRIRYAVSQVTNPVGAAPHFSNAANLKLNGITTAPNDLIVCASSTFAGFNAVAGTCPSPSTNAVTNTNVVAAVIWSHGKNYTSMPAGNVDEQINNKHRLPAALNNNPTFVWHDVRPVGAVGGEYDDVMLWIPAGQLYGRLIAAGVLP